jgi:signal transduction histidine kinase
MNYIPLRKILIIDDDAQSVMLLRHILEPVGYMVTGSLSGIEGLIVLENFQPDLILLDIIMPDPDGYQVCEMIKSNPELSVIPIIFITASHDPQQLVQGFEAGAVDFISKPFNKSELLARINTHIELKHSRDTISKQNESLLQEVEWRKLTQEKFRALSEMTFEAVIFINQDKIIEYNKAAEDLFALQSKGEPLLLKKAFSHEIVKTLQGFIRIRQGGPWELILTDSNGKDFFALVQHRMISYMQQDVDVLAFRDISRQKEMDKLVFDAILQTEEKERMRFSRDMHDGLGALLSTLKIYLNLLNKENKSIEQKQILLSEMKDMINQAITTARTIANDIMPSMLMDYGLYRALVVFVESLNKTNAISIDFQYPETVCILDEKTQTHFYRIVLELINNTLRHANATEARLSIYLKDEHCILEYMDNGTGFNIEAISFQDGNGQGLKNIYSRVNFLNGKAKFLNSDVGTKFLMEIPV